MAGKKKKPKASPDMYSKSCQVAKASKITKENEESLREMAKQQAPKADERAAEGTAKTRHVKMLRRLIGRLLSDGFLQRDVEDALRHAIQTEAREHGIEDAALDYLCLHVQPLPAQFATTHVASETDSRNITFERRAKATASTVDPRPAAVAPEGYAVIREKSPSGAQKKAERVQYVPPAPPVQAAPAGGYDSDESSTASSEDLDAALIREMTAQYGGGTRKGKRNCNQPGGGKNTLAPAAAPKAPSALEIPPDAPEEDQLARAADMWGSLTSAASEAKARGDKDAQRETGLQLRRVKEQIAALNLPEAEVQALARAAYPPVPAPKKPAVPSKADSDDEAPPIALEDLVAEATSQVPKALPVPDPGALLRLLRSLNIVPRTAGKAKPNAPSKPPEYDRKQPVSLLQVIASSDNTAQPAFTRIPPGPLFAAKVSVKGTTEEFGFAPGDAGEDTALRKAEASAGDARQAAAVLALFRMACREDPEGVGAGCPYYALLPAEWAALYEEMYVAAFSAAADGAAPLAEKLARLLAAAPAGSDDAAADPAAPAAAADAGLHRVQLAGAGLRKAEADASRALHDAISRRRAAVPADIQAVRDGLPATGLRDELVQVLADGDFAVVAGETGCGKTTQVPQYILEHAERTGAGGVTSIVCTQPRRLAAISVAERVAKERGEAVLSELRQTPKQGSSQGRPAQGYPSTVGYHVRLDAKASADTRLLFCTTGILLRKLNGDPFLSQTSHVVVDEVHERSMQSDFLLAQLRRVSRARRAAGRRPLKVVLMSATVDPSLFSRYFDDARILTVHGRTFPVQAMFLEDVYEETGYELDGRSPAALKAEDEGAMMKELDDLNAASATLADWEMHPPNPQYTLKRYGGFSLMTRRNIAHLNESAVDLDLVLVVVEHIEALQARDAAKGSILVFFSGLADILRARDLLQTGPSRKTSARRIVCLHSTIPHEEQQLAFESPPENVTKIVLATNIAETSITVSDVVHVVDTGKVNATQYNAVTGLTALQQGWISKANSKQRRGRAGRVRPGFYYALFTKDRHESFPDFERPEMLRMPLTDLCLQSKVIAPSRTVAEVLNEVIEPPPSTSIEAAVTMLLEAGALTVGPKGHEALTDMGRHLASLPVDILLGKLLIISVGLGVVAPVLTVAAALSYKSPFLSTKGSAGPSESVRKRAFSADSDHLAMVQAFDGWDRAPGWTQKKQFCVKNNLSHQALEMIADLRQQFALCLVDAGFLPCNRREVANDGKPWNQHAKKPLVVKAALCFAFHTHVAVAKDAAGRRDETVFTNNTQELVVHKTSVNSGMAPEAFRHPYVVYHYVMTLGTSPMGLMTDTSVVPAAVLLLFAADLKIDHRKRGAVVNDWLWLPEPAQLTVIAKMLRRSIADHLSKLLKRDSSSAVVGSLLPEPIVTFLEQNESSRVN